MNKTKIITALKIWLAIYPSITFFLFVFSEAISAFSLPVKTLILTSVLVPWVVFAGIPVINFLQKRFFKMISKKNYGHQK